LGETEGGAVFKAYDRMLDRLVAVKLFELPLPDSAANADAITRFRTGAKAGAKLSHPYIVPVFDYGETANHAWIVMELVDGASLREILNHGERYTLPAILRLMEQVLSALAYAHENGVVHRGVKPGNIMITTNSMTKETTARLTDFGIGRMEDRAITAVGSGHGTPAYMAPEQFGGPVDHRADLWAAGAVFYELLTGQAPFEGDYRAVCLKITTIDPEPPSQITPLPPAVDAVVARAMTKPPDGRFQSAAEFVAALRILRPLTTPAEATIRQPPPPPQPPLQPQPQPQPQQEAQPRPVLTPGRPARPMPKREEAVGDLAEDLPEELPEEPAGGRFRRPLYWAVGAGLGVCALVAVAVLLNGELLPAPQPLPSLPPTAMTPAPQPGQTPAAAPAPLFERAAAAVRRMDCALLAVEADDRHLAVRGVLRDSAANVLRGTIDAFGLPPGSVQLDLQTFDADLCQVLQTVRPVAVQGDALPNLALISPDPLPAGQNLRFRVQTPGRPTYLHVLFFGAAGQVGNMVQSDRPLAPSSSLDFGEPYWTAAAPYGTGLLVAITSDSVLYTKQRPAVETPADALDALSFAIQSAQHRGERIEARVITATSAPPS
jgi:serine/threonine-protein kinase